MKNEIVLSCVLLGLVGIMTSAVVTAQQIYRNDKYGIQMQPPTDWIVVESGEYEEGITYIVTFYPLGETWKDKSYYTNINIVTEKVWKGTTLWQYVSANKLNLSLFLDNFEILDERERTIGPQALEAHELVWTYLLLEDNVKVKQIFFLKGEKAFVVTYGALMEDFDKYLPDFETSLTTFEFVSGTNWGLVLALVGLGAGLGLVFWVCFRGRKRRKKIKLACPYKLRELGG